MEETKVTINGKEYLLQKLKWGQQRQIGKLFSELYSGMKQEVNAVTQEVSTSMDFSSMLSAAADLQGKILSIVLKIPESEIDEGDAEEVMSALETVFEVNHIGELLKKSVNLLGSSLKA